MRTCTSVRLQVYLGCGNVRLTGVPLPGRFNDFIQRRVARACFRSKYRTKTGASGEENPTVGAVIAVPPLPDLFSRESEAELRASPRLPVGDTSTCSPRNGARGCLRWS